LNIKRNKEVNYESFVASRIKDGNAIIASLNKARANLWHLGTGVAGEAGELVDAIKKHVVYGKDIDLENVIEELGDLEFYMQGIRTAIGVTREEVLEANVAKLEKRYSQAYTDQAAIERADKQ
jgi:NTP pyrophosphatase (non-canonical NTP hydrolase)